MRAYEQSVANIYDLELQLLGRANLSRLINFVNDYSVKSSNRELKLKAEIFS